MVLNLCVRIKISVAKFDANHYVTDNTRSIVASIKKLPDSVVKTAELTIDSRCVRRNHQLIDQFEVSR